MKINCHFRFPAGFHFRFLWLPCLIGLSMAGLAACEKAKSYPATPEISLKQVEVADLDTFGTTVRAVYFTLNFVDGDGNLSDSRERPLVIIPPDTVGRDTSTNSKVFLKFFEKNHGIYQPMPDSLFLTPPSFQIPYGDAMSREGQNKTQKGEMKINYLFFYTDGNKLPYDTIQVELYIVDLAYMKSNVVTATDIVLTKK